MREFDYQRLVIAYHGCDVSTRDAVIQKGGQLKIQPNEYDWLGHGIYFWEHGPARALEWAKAQKRRGKGNVATPAVLGAVLHLGRCFDLLDAKYTDVLAEAYPRFEESTMDAKKPVPKNRAANKTDQDQLLRELDCAVVNWTIKRLEQGGEGPFHSVRGVFQEGAVVFPESGIRRRSHIQIAVRNPACILGYFQPPPDSSND